MTRPVMWFLAGVLSVVTVLGAFVLGAVLALVGGRAGGRIQRRWARADARREQKQGDV